MFHDANRSPHQPISKNFRPMKIFCKGMIRPTDGPKPGFVEWIKSQLSFKENLSGIHFDINSDSPVATEFTSRLRHAFDVMPLMFWHIEYSKKEIAEAKLLHLWSNQYIAELAMPPCVERVELAATRALYSPKFFGSIRPFGSVVACNAALKERLSSKSLNGLSWVDLPPRKGGAKHQPIWRISSSVTLPESPIPLKQSYGDPFDGDYGKGCHYRSAFREEELAYTQQSLDELSHFDVALTHEKTGNYPGTFFQSLVVSQNFRIALENEKIRGAKYTPVRILQAGDSVIRQPLDCFGQTHPER
jgi:hypothetical protein